MPGQGPGTAAVIARIEATKQSSRWRMRLDCFASLVTTLVGALAQTARSHRYKPTGRLVADRKLAGGDTKIGAVDGDLVELDQFPQPRKRLEIVEAVGDVGLFEPGEIIRPRNVTLRAGLFRRRRHQPHPVADEVA